MSLRPPSIYRIVVTATGGAGSSDATSFTLAASGDSTVPQTLGTMRLAGVLFLGVGNYVASPSVLPPRTPALTQPQNATLAIPGPMFLEVVDASINASTTAFPFALVYTGAGIGGT